MEEFNKRPTFKIVIRRIERPFSDDPFKELDWICQSLGFFEPIDKDKTASAIFREIVSSTEKRQSITSTSLAESVGMSRGSVINHLNNLLRSGLIIRVGRQYTPRSKSVYRTIEEIEEDVDRIFERMKKIAKAIDQEMGVITPEK